MPAGGERAESPCTGVCTMHPRAGICAGCLRTLAEIAAWRDLGDTERRRILDALPARAGLVRKRP